jgi:Protein of unknown function (DUF559)
MTSPREQSITLDDLLAWQDGVLATRSALTYLSPGALRWRLESGRWQQPCRGVAVVHSGPLTDAQMLWVAIMWAGRGAALAGLTSARLQGFRGFDEKVNSIHLLLPAARTARDTPPPFPVVVHYSRSLTAADIHPVRRPPQTRIARSLVDAAAWMATDRGAQAVLAAGVQQRLVRAADLAAELDRNERLHRRKLLRTAIADSGGGAHALSELDFTTLVVRHFGLPEPSRQVPRLDGQGRRRWLDVCWEEARLVVEIDGAAHLDALQYWDDMDRSNDLTLDHHVVLRFPAWVIRDRPAYVAAKIKKALREAGYCC